MSGARILVVDDEPDVRALVATLLERAGHAVVAAADGREALRRLYEERPDLVVLDVAMPGLDGWGTLERIRDLSDVPVLMLTARGGELDKVRGLHAGADDYVTKPFGRQELLARVEALLRRAESPPAAPRQRGYADACLELDPAGMTVAARGEPVELTPLEFRLLAALVEHRGRVLSAEQLLELAWREPGGGSRERVKIYVGYLRRKLAAAAGQKAPIETVRGFGYRYRPPRKE